ncbi:MAG: glycosyltransferase family 4 protein [Pirellulaceae bacterium]
MKVLLNTPPLDRLGGVANFYLDLRGHIGDEVVYFYIGRRNGESPLLAVFRLLADYLRFVWVLWRQRFDIVHLNPSLGPLAIWRDGIFVLIARAFGKKTVVFMHGWNRDYEQRIRRRGMWLFRLTYFRVDAVIVLANEFQASLRSMGYVGPVEVMTTTFNSDLLSGAKRCRTRTDSSEPFHILFLSRIERQKGIMESLRAFAILQANQPNVRMTVAGTGAALEEAQEYVRHNNVRNVAFLGYVRGQQKTEAYSRAHCCLFPTYWGEGMPITVVEAMAFGLPVITRPVGALADFFRDGEMGFVTESKDPAVFAQLVARLMEMPNLCEQMSRTNREYAMRHFAAPGVAARLRATYQTVIAGEACASGKAEGNS